MGTHNAVVLKPMLMIESNFLFVIHPVTFLLHFKSFHICLNVDHKCQTQMPYVAGN